MKKRHQYKNGMNEQSLGRRKSGRAQNKNDKDSRAKGYVFQPGKATAQDVW